ncbi:hypothetical protein H2199_009130 [Coniosporium tulheliwenetii]|uniref:Uncharacterized protein n=1 Tax=Coniosporium tulheliwenetii TaxID=3383036 RepID=A0ACC2YFN9_9PEZI|nr:hypothetical protein H2199_009130 [Cladosporium sp. JES 115]
MLYPVQDYDEFMQEVVPTVLKEGFGDGCQNSLIAILVFALASNGGPHEGYAVPPFGVIEELDRQLESWRSVLPQRLQWRDEDRTQYSWYDSQSRQRHYTQFTARTRGTRLVLTSNIDVVTAQLRSGFYYCRFMIYRPFLYKAVHSPSK